MTLAFGSMASIAEEISLRERMGDEVFRADGLHRLMQEELETLEAWLEDPSSALASPSESNTDAADNAPDDEWPQRSASDFMSARMGPLRRAFLLRCHEIAAQ